MALLAAVVASLAGAPRAVAEPLYLLSMAAGGWPIAVAALTALRRRTLDMNVLMALAAIGAVGIGDYAEGAWVLVLFAVGTTLEALALDRSRRSVEALMELAPEEAQVLVDGVERTVAVAEIAPGAVLRVRPGERVPLDGDIVEGASSVDESALTGESVPVDKEAGDAVFAGTLNAFGALTIRTTASAADTTLARVARLVAEAQGSRAPTERFIDRFARIYTPLVFVAALLLAVVPVLLGGDLDTWLYRALALLIVACPCALVISVPVAVVSAVGGAARAGVLIKGGEALEALGRIDTVAVDKTGTLTAGRPRLASIEGADDRRGRALALVAAVEQGSEHPLGQTLLRAARDRRLDVPAAHAFTALPGRGAEATVDGRALWAGGPRLAAERTGAQPAGAAVVAERGETAGRARRGRARPGGVRARRPAPSRGGRRGRRPAARRRATRGHAHGRQRGRGACRRRARRRHGVARRAAPGGQARRGARAGARRQRGHGRRRRQRRARARGRRRGHRHGRGRQRRRARVGRRRAHGGRARSACPRPSARGAARCGSSARTSSPRWPSRRCSSCSPRSA